MVELIHNDKDKIKKYYEESKDSCGPSVLQGYMGQAFADNKENPVITLLLVGDFLYPSGDCSQMDDAGMKAIMDDMNSYRDKHSYIIIPQNQVWKDYLTKQEDLQMVKRYSLNKPDLSEFDQKELLRLSGKLGAEYEFKRMDASLAKTAMSMDWSKDFCANYQSPEDYEKRGLGVAILHHGELVCGASSYSSYDQGIEVEIATKLEYRSQGLATMCGAKLILECIKEHKLPNWDAANLSSVAIAKKLGYQFAGEYETFVNR